MSEIHISLDDVKGIFKVLSTKKLSSIFETRTLNFLRKMHKLYGTKFNLFCTYKNGDFSLDKVSDAYLEEFKNNTDWLKFGFHCYDEGIVYVQGMEKDFEHHFDCFQTQIKRITGQEGVVTPLRIHSFQGNRRMCKILHQKGVMMLLTADDSRVSYYLDDIATKELKNCGYYYDKDLKMSFVRSCTRLENSENIIREMEFYRRMETGIISIFTHEWQMDREDIRYKLELCCKPRSDEIW